MEESINSISVFSILYFLGGLVIGVVITNIVNKRFSKVNDKYESIKKGNTNNA